MALTLRRRTSQLTFVLLAAIAALFSGLVLAFAFDANVRYSPFNIEEPVRHGAPLHIVGGIGGGGGGFEAEFDESNNTYYQRLTGFSNKLGDVLTLVSTSDENSSGAPVYENKGVYVGVYDRGSPSGAFRWWGWRKEGETEWFLVETSKEERAEFKIVPGGPCPLIYYCYYIQSCPGSFCSNLTPYPEDEAIYIKLGDENPKLFSGLSILFKPATAISMPTDA